jgi:hypothetical protein
MDCENVNTGGLELDLQPETRAERGFLQLRAAGALLQESQAEVNCRGNGEKHDSRHRPAHGAISSVNCH